MANDMNVTLHFNYEQDAASYSKVMSALDQLQKKGVETLKVKGMSDVQINEYINGFTKMKHAIESSFSPDLTTFSVGYASQLKEFQEGYATVQKYTDGAKVSIDNMGDSLDNGALKIDKYSDKLDHFKLTLANAFRYNVVNRAIDMITNSIREMIDYVIELDSALNSIRIITGKSTDEMLQFAAANQDSAKELGRTATEYAQASLIFYQQGLDDSQVKERTDAALKLANVTGQSVQEIVNQMTAIWNNFDDGVHNLEYYEDVITALGATTASSSKEIAAGLEKFAAIGDTVGLSYEYAASALATVVATTRQSEDVVGTAFKTMFARLQSLKLGETLDDGTTLTKYTQALESIGVSVLDQNGNLKDMDAILDEIGAKWESLDRNQQTALANTVGGVRQYAQFIALFDNFDFFKENVTTALESAGTVTQQNTIYMESYEVKIKQIKATLDSIKFDMFMDQDFGGLLDFADSFLVSLRTIIHDFGGFNQILTVTGALLAQMFLPQIIQKFSQEFMKLKTQMDSMSNMSFGEKLKKIFSPKAGFKDINSVFNGLLDNYQNFENKTELVKRAQHDLGEEAGTSLGKLIDKYREAQAEVDSFENQVSQIDYSTLMENIQESIINSSDWTDAQKNSFLTLLDDLEIPEGAVGSVEKYYEFLKKIKETIPALNALNIDVLNGEKIAKEADRAKTALEQFKKQWESLSTMGQITKLASAGAVAFRGLASAFEKFQEGDLLGGIAGGLTSIGTALMMIPGAQLAGGILTAAGTVTSVIKSQIEKAEKEARETLDNYVETKKKYEDTISSLDEISKKYNRLSSKSSLTVDEQNELNNALEEMQKIMSEDGTYNLIAYYDEYGNAVYKTIDVINEYVEALKEKQRAELEDKKQEAEEAKNKVIKKDSTIQKYENYRDSIKKYNDIINTIKTNNWSFEDIQKYTNVDWSQLGISTVSGVISYYEGYISRAETEVERIGNEFSSKIKDYWKDQFDYEITIPLDEFKINIDDKNGKLFIDQLKSKINDAIQNGEIDVDKIYISSITEGLSEIKDWEGFLRGDAVALNELKNAIGENNVILPLITSLINENSNALQNHKVMVKDVAMGINELADSINDSVEHWNTIDEAYKQLNDTGLVTVETIAKIAEQFADFEGIDDVVESLLAGTMSLQDFNEISDEWFDSYIKNLDIVKNVTYENESEVIAILEKRYGVTNAAAVVQDQLNQKEQAGAIASKNLTDKLAAYGIKASDFIAWCEEQGISLNHVEDDARYAQSAINDYQSAVDSGSGSFDVSQILNPLQDTIDKAKEAIQILRKLGTISTRQGNIATWVGNIAKGIFDKIKNNQGTNATYESGGTPAERDKTTSPSGGGGGGGGGGGAAEEEYEATIDKYEKYKNQLKDIEDEISLIQERIKNEKDPLIKNELLIEKNKKLQEHNNLLHETNELYRADAAEAYNWLLENGFDIYYNPDKQEYTIKNWEKINEVTKESTKATNEWRKEAEAQKKILEDNNKACEENSKKWRDNTQAIKENQEQIIKNQYDSYKDTRDDKLFYTTFYEGLASGLPQLRSIYTEVLQDAMDELDYLYSQGLDNTDSQVQEVWKEIKKFEKEIDKIDTEAYNNRIKNIERIQKALPETAGTYEERMYLAQQKIDATNEEINRLFVLGTEEALDKILDLYEQNAKNIKDKYKGIMDELKEEQNDMKDALDGVTALIDEEIEKVKKEKEEAQALNDEHEKELELMKLKSDLSNAQNQKTVRVYRRGQGFVWEANKKAINDAQKALNDFNKKSEENSYDKRIKELEEIKKSWSGIPNTIKDANNKEKAEMLLGADWEKKILSGRADVQQDFLEKYKRNSAEQIRVAQEETKALEAEAEKVKDLVELKDSYLNPPEQEQQETRQPRIFYADAQGHAPADAQIGDIILTAGGMFLKASKKFENAVYNEETKSYSVKLDDASFLAPKDMLGQEVVDPAAIAGINQFLEDNGVELSELMPELNENISNAGLAAANIPQSVSMFNDGLNIYTSTMVATIEHGQDLVEAAGIHSRTAEAASQLAEQMAALAEKYKNEAQAAAAAAGPPDTGGKHHKGLEAGPVGSIASQQAYNKEFMRIARGDLKDDEVFSLLKKGESVLTEEQLNNVVGTLNYSLDSVGKLSKLNNKMFDLGQMSNFDITPNDVQSGQNISFGDIHIQMNGVNDVESFANVLRNNIKGIFAQTISKE